jgi:hypothetical protein
MIVAKLAGSCARWSSNGVLYHLLRELPQGKGFTAVALCGAKPRGISNGWTEDTGPATCKRCLKRQHVSIGGEQT